jgi:hypothetical protein
MNTTTDRDNEETVFQSSHREWVEDQELRQQERDQRAAISAIKTPIGQQTGLEPASQTRRFVTSRPTGSRKGAKWLELLWTPGLLRW